MAGRFFSALLLLCVGTMISARSAFAAGNASPCVRYPVGGTLVEPEDLFSSNGLLHVDFSYETGVDSGGNPTYCFVNSRGSQSPTLHVHPGDELVIVLKNNLPSSSVSAMAGMPEMSISAAASLNCGSTAMTLSSVNMHFHGTNTSPVCHQDEVIRTVINSGESFEYDVHFPANEPPGLYWYHPHIHGMSEPAVQGGASGAIVVEGIQNVAPEVAGLPEHLIILRDQLLPGNPANPPANAPAWDISVNYAPVPFPAYTPVNLAVKPGEKQLWRVLNGSADTILDLQLQYDGVAQPLRIIALDGVPTNSADGTMNGTPITSHDVLLPPAGRVEFVMTGPAVNVRSAELVTLNVDTGPDGDYDPLRPLMKIHANPNAPSAALSVPAVNGGPASPSRFANLQSAIPTAHRRLYFSEVLTDPSDPNSPTNFFITVDGHKPVLFSPDNPPAIVTTQGAVEDWVIENRALENHEFHIHQIHFLLLDRNGVPVNGQYLDTVNVPYWSGSGPYPSIKVRMDFRGNVTGDFVYHCHILGHEDGGMMAIIRVLPAP